MNGGRFFHLHLWCYKIDGPYINVTDLGDWRSRYSATGLHPAGRGFESLISHSNNIRNCVCVYGGVVELVDTADLKSSGLTVRAGSSPAPATIKTLI